VSILFTRDRPPAAAEARSGSYTLQQLAGLVAGSVRGVPTVTSDTAMRHDAVWSCRTRIAQDVSMMPVDTVRYVNKQRQEVTPAPQIIVAPSVNIPALDWRYQVVDSWLADGNAWGLVTETTADGRYPTRIELVAHNDVRPSASGVRFEVHGKERALWPVGDLWWVPAYTVAGQMLGLSPIGYHRETIRNGLAAERFSGDFFLDGGHPSGVLTVAGDPGEKAGSLKERLLNLTKGTREPLILPAGTDWKQMQVNPSDSQFIDTMRYTAEQVCRIYGEDPADHGCSGSGGAITYANRSDADLARFKRRQFWVTKLQESLTALLPRPQVVKLNTSSSLMMTAKERHELHQLRLRNKTTTINEVRRIEDETPFDAAANANPYENPGLPAAVPLASPGTAPDPTQGGAA